MDRSPAATASSDDKIAPAEENAANDAADKKNEISNSELAVALPKYDFSVVVRVGGEHFVGFIKCVAACSE